MRSNKSANLAVTGFNLSTIAVMITVAGMWFTTAVDWFFNLGWGWDRQILWIGPVIVVGTMIVRLLGHGIFRWVGAASPKA